jgi:hypothetical protein
MFLKFHGRGVCQLAQFHFSAILYQSYFVKYIHIEVQSLWHLSFSDTHLFQSLSVNCVIKKVSVLICLPSCHGLSCTCYLSMTWKDVNT